MQYAQTRAETLTRGGGGRCNGVLMQSGRIVLVLIGIVLVEGTGVRAGG
jgi:hypothetical protein